MHTSLAILGNIKTGLDAIAIKPGTPAEMRRWLADSEISLDQHWTAIERYGDEVANDATERNVKHLGDLTEAYTAAEYAYSAAVWASIHGALAVIP